METNIVCPHCNTDMNNYKCEYNCSYCNTIYCLSCREPFYIEKNISYKGHQQNCYINNIKSKL
jgi:hypothetical protein